MVTELTHVLEKIEQWKDRTSKLIDSDNCTNELRSAFDNAVAAWVEGKTAQDYARTILPDEEELLREMDLWPWGQSEERLF